MSRKRFSQKESALETLRLDYTDLNQDEFVIKIGVSRTTYQRWIREDKEPRLTPSQITNICSICKISFNTFFESLGLDISEVPKK